MDHALSFPISGTGFSSQGEKELHSETLCELSAHTCCQGPRPPPESEDGHLSRAGHGPSTSSAFWGHCLLEQGETPDLSRGTGSWRHWHG